jgi:hypothetical protein
MAFVMLLRGFPLFMPDDDWSEMCVRLRGVPDNTGGRPGGTVAQIASDSPKSSLLDGMRQYFSTLKHCPGGSVHKLCLVETVDFQQLTKNVFVLSCQVSRFSEQMCEESCVPPEKEMYAECLENFRVRERKAKV